VGEFVNYGFLIERLEELCGAFGVGVADKNLAESVVVNHANQAFYPLCVELVEHVVEQQDGLSAERLMKHFKRCEFEGNQETFLLALGPDALQRMAVEREVKVFAVRSG
jgi:hypothetical protein